MPRFMLDTDTCSYIMKRSHPLVLKRLQAVPVDDVCMSVVTKAELLYGVEVSPCRVHDAAALAAFLPYVETVDLDEGAALRDRKFKRLVGSRASGLPRSAGRLWVNERPQGGLIISSIVQYLLSLPRYQLSN